jgi:hypothetical protein
MLKYFHIKKGLNLVYFSIFLHEIQCLSTYPWLLSIIERNKYSISARKPSIISLHLLTQSLNVPSMWISRVCPSGLAILKQSSSLITSTIYANFDCIQRVSAPCFCLASFFSCSDLSFLMLSLAYGCPCSVGFFLF